MTQEKNKLVVVKGVAENFVVINTDDVLFSCPRDEASIQRCSYGSPFERIYEISIIYIPSAPLTIEVQSSW